MSAQTVLSPSPHSDLTTSLVFSPQSTHLASASLDSTIRISRRSPSASAVVGGGGPSSAPSATGPATTSTPSYDQDTALFKAHDGPVLCLAWAPAELGLILASGGVDGTVKIWREPDSTSYVRRGFARAHHHPHHHGQPSGATSSTSRPFSSPFAAHHHPTTTGREGPNGSTTTRGLHASVARDWLNTATLSDARGTVRAVGFAPSEFGLRLASVSSDDRLRVWESVDPVRTSEWTLVQEIDLGTLPFGPSAATVSSSGAPGGGGAGSTGQATGAGSSGFSSDREGDAGGGGGGGTGGAQAGTASGSAVGSTGSGTHAPGGGGGGTNTTSSLGGSSVDGRGFQRSGGGGPSHGSGGTVESDGGWSLSWCREHWWGERLAVSAGSNGMIRLFHLPSHGPWSNFLNLVPTRSVLSSHPGAAASSSTSGPFSHSAPHSASSSSHRDAAHDPHGPSSSSSASSTPYPHSSDPYSSSTPSGGLLGPTSSSPFHMSPTSSLAWAPPSGRSYQLLASGSRDGKARVWKIYPPIPSRSSVPSSVTGATVVGGGMRMSGLDTSAAAQGGGGGGAIGGGIWAGPEGEWTAQLDVELDESKRLPQVLVRSSTNPGSGSGTGGGGGGAGTSVGSGGRGESPNGSGVQSASTAGGAGGGGGGQTGAIGSTRVEWNVTGTVLSTCGGEDGRVRLWKSTYTGQWRQITSLSTETPPMDSQNNSGFADLH
ncbi:hypothetical protein JCM10212_005048 [Sporobolomyces blumeae]